MQRHWPLTGRAEESGVIAELIDGDGSRGVVIAGRPGVGKSRMAREAATAAMDSGWEVRHVAATATGGSVPLGAFAQWADGDEGNPLSLARKVIDAITAGTHPGRLLVSIDDAHLLDDLSALVVLQLVVQQSATVIATIRSGQPTPDAVTALWKDGLVQRLELQPLSYEESAELLQAVLDPPPDRDCADRLWALTAGNVLFLRHLVDQALREGRLVKKCERYRWRGDPAISPSLVEVVEQQIGAIAEGVRNVIDIVSVSEPLGWDILTTLVDRDSLEEAEQRELIRTSGNDVLIGHPMYAEVRRKQCGPIRLRRLRGLVATAMTRTTETANVVRRGLLWLESDLPPNPEVLAAAAGAASSLLDFDLAARLSVAANASGGVGTRIHLAYNLLMSQQGEIAAAAIDEISPDEVPESAFINDVVLRAANLLWSMRAPEESWRVIDEALEDATGARRGQLLAFRANQLVLAARPAEVVAMMDTVDYGTLDDYGQSVRLCAEALALAEVGRNAEAVVKAQSCYHVLDASQQGNFLRQPLVEFHSFGLSSSGRIREAVELSEKHRDDCAASPSTARAMASAIAGMVALTAGDLRSAVRQLPSENAGEDTDMILANSFFRFNLLRAQALARSGDVAAAAEAVRIADADRHPTYVLVEPDLLLAKAWLAAARQRLSEARQFARAAAEFAHDHGQLAREVHCLQTAAQFDDTTVADLLTELARIVEGPRVTLAADYARAVSTDDAAQLTRASVDFEALGDLLTAADAAAQAATSHRRARRGGSAMTAATRAASLAARCGATSPALAAAKLNIPLTRREREIAVLVAQGLTNRDIAQSISLSVRTVEGYVYRASCKAGVARRSELASVMQCLFVPAAPTGAS